MTDLDPAGYERADDGRVLISAAHGSQVAVLGCDSLARAFALPAIARSAWKAWAELPLPGGGRAYLKRWDYDRREVWVRSALKWNWPVWSGPRELANLLALAAAGLRVPVPLAAGEEDAGPRRRSFVLLLGLAGASLDALPPPAGPRDRHARVRAVAGLVRRLHAAGFWHKDLYLGNVFWDDAAGPGLIDCERVERAEGGPPSRWRVKDLAALDGSAQGWSATDRVRFLRTYLACERLDAPAKRLARAVRRKARRMAKHGAKGS